MLTRNERIVSLIQFLRQIVRLIFNASMRYYKQHICSLFLNTILLLHFCVCTFVHLTFTSRFSPRLIKERLLSVKYNLSEGIFMIQHVRPESFYSKKIYSRISFPFLNTFLYTTIIIF